ncbi:helix-turn-helix transcriptional regulator [Rhizorhabdus wittichii]|uniref:Helix-turn-helix transcriptional regulator n=1 Tax=Rhizorhabdus wittichii TaxID=160791 RepID=A0A975HCF9_9SPHN|nr:MULTISPECIES: AraC family transcriptional regulator [Sphingomonadaceae]QTH20218.1 helix-turn-helix transcriptional regulator [Rhizorhabdus wittichii]
MVEAEGYVLILVAEILAILEAAQDDSAVVPRLSDRDFDKIHLVRERLIRGTIPPPSLKELARDVGLGPTKLKDGFKALFGQSIFAFSHDIRMRHARDLLRRNDMSIARVAEAVGYDYQQSFTVAFQRYFGVLPRNYRRNPVTLDQNEQEARWSAMDSGNDLDRMFGAGGIGKCVGR